jgi:hypothetical protein
MPGRPALAAMASMATRARGTAGRSLLLFVRRISQHRPLAMPDYHLHEVKRDGSIAKRSVVLSRYGRKVAWSFSSRVTRVRPA